jgi:hypothetical protein
MSAGRLEGGRVFRLAKRFADLEIAAAHAAGDREKTAKLATVATSWLPSLVLNEDFAGKTGAVVKRVRTPRYLDVRIEECTPISNQIDIGSCEANGWMDAFEMLMPPAKVVQLSRMFCYWTSRRTHGAECVDEGTYAVAVARAAQELGICTESLCPYDGRSPSRGGTCNDRPDDLAFAESYAHRLGECYAVRAYGSKGQERIKTIKAVLDMGFPVPNGTLIGPEYFDADMSDDKAFDAPTTIVGGHEQVFTGYREFSDGALWLLQRGSWGEDWARNGRTWIKAEYAADRIACDEVSVPTLPPSF